MQRPPAAHDRMPEITLLTMNAHMGFSLSRRRFVLHELREAIRSVSADVVCLQEVLGEHRGHARRIRHWPEHPQYEFLADTTWSQFAYGRNAVYPHGHHGNAVLSKYPIAHHENRDVSIRGHENRGLLHCRLDVPGSSQGVHVVCVHLGLRESHRQRQLGLLCDLAAEIPPEAPLVVAGDFNDWRLRGHPRLRQCGLEEVFERVHGRLARTFPARWPRLALDRIYVRNAEATEVAALAARPWSHLSDHAPLRACIRL